MVTPEKTEGICSTCKFKLECQILKRSQREGRVILHCEEFDDPDAVSKEDREKSNPVAMYSENLIPGWD